MKSIKPLSVRACRASPSRGYASTNASRAVAARHLISSDDHLIGLIGWQHHSDHAECLLTAGLRCGSISFFCPQARVRRKASARSGERMPRFFMSAFLDDRARERDDNVASSGELRAAYPICLVLIRFAACGGLAIMTDAKDMTESESYIIAHL
jgi:hypothetical protein